MKRLILLFFILISLNICAQTNIVIDVSVKHQTIQGFGASDAWNIDYVGKYWSLANKTNIAEKLFSKTFDINGTPKGIGLSRWRFNIGGGSSEQGDASNIDALERRVECFLNGDGTFNWDKQAGQQWFLNQAKEYGVEQLVAFVNSPPRFFTKNGRTNSDNTDAYGSTNLKDGFSGDYATFLAKVLKHFDDKEIHFSQISPVNEPQFPWKNGQEGCPWKNMEITELVGELNATIINTGLSTKILLAESESYYDLYQDNGNTAKANQIDKFFSYSKPEYIGNKSQILHGLCSHSYWTDGDDVTLKKVRENAYNKAKAQGIELYQTEYNLLSKSYDNYLTNSIFLAKIIYADLTIANVSIWDYWTAVERERWNQKNRFYLIRLQPSGGDYADLTSGGSIGIDKNLWVLGNYSLFIRPGYQRIKTIGADDLSGLMASAYMAPDSSKIVAVYVNWGTDSIPVTQTISNLPTNLRVESITPYVTDVKNNLKVKVAITLGSAYTISPKSVTTMVIELNKTLSSTTPLKSEKDFVIFPNPSNGYFKIETQNDGFYNLKFSITDISGKTILSNQSYDFCQSQTINLSEKPNGIYFINSNGWIRKMIKY